MTPIEIIDAWPSFKDLADDLGLKDASHVRTMRARGRIPRAYWHDMADAAGRRKVAITLDVIRDAHAGIPPRASAASEKEVA